MGNHSASSHQLAGVLADILWCMLEEFTFPGRWEFGFLQEQECFRRGEDQS
jgi:hypothetical protein